MSERSENRREFKIPLYRGIPSSLPRAVDTAIGPLGLWYPSPDRCYSLSTKVRSFNPYSEFNPFYARVTLPAGMESVQDAREQRALMKGNRQENIIQVLDERDQESDSRAVRAGVPQGMVAGKILRNVKKRGVPD